MELITAAGLLKFGSPAAHILSNSTFSIISNFFYFLIEVNQVRVNIIN